MQLLSTLLLIIMILLLWVDLLLLLLEIILIGCLLLELLLLWLELRRNYSCCKVVGLAWHACRWLLISLTPILRR